MFASASATERKGIEMARAHNTDCGYPLSDDADVQPPNGWTVADFFIRENPIDGEAVITRGWYKAGFVVFWRPCLDPENDLERVAYLKHVKTWGEVGLFADDVLARHAGEIALRVLPASMEQLSDEGIQGAVMALCDVWREAGLFVSDKHDDYDRLLWEVSNDAFATFADQLRGGSRSH